MRRLAVAVLAVALAGCGDGKPQDQAQEPVKREARRASKAIERVRKSDIPKDAQRELEEAQRLLDELDDDK